MTEQRIIELLNKDIVAGMELLDDFFLQDYQSGYTDLAREFYQQPNNFSIGNFRDRLIRFVKLNSHKINTTTKEDSYDVLCKLNFKHHKKYFESAVKSNKIFLSFIIRGKEENYGQRWLINNLIHNYNKRYPIHPSIIIDLMSTNINLSEFVTELSTQLGVNDKSGAITNEKIRVKYNLYDRLKTKSQFIILKNAYQFIHSNDYFEFYNMLKSYSDELNNSSVSCKCILFLVEEQINSRYTKTNNCHFSEDISILKARQFQDFSFLDLGETKPINSDDILEWLELCSDEYLEPFKPLVNDFDRMNKFIGDGHPNRLINSICSRLNINFLDNENTWMKI